MFNWYVLLGAVAGFGAGYVWGMVAGKNLAMKVMTRLVKEKLDA